MFGFENAQGGGADREGLQKELERAQAEKLRVIAQPDSSQKEGMLRALNDIIANLQEQIGTGLETATDAGHIEESVGDVNTERATGFITKWQGWEDVLPEEAETELAELTKSLLAAQAVKPDSKRIQMGLTLLSDIRTRNEERKAGQ